MRGGAVRDRVPGRRHPPYAGRIELPGLQPLRRLALLFGELSLQGAVFQLVRLPVERLAQPARAAVESGCHGAQQGGHGEMHLLRAAPHRGEVEGAHRRADRARWGSAHRLRPGLPVTRRSTSAISPTARRRSPRCGRRSRSSCLRIRRKRTSSAKRTSSWTRTRRSCAATAILEDLRTYPSIVYLERIRSGEA